MRVEHIGNATLYCGDCLEILPTLGDVDAVITDPPYGVSGAVNSKTKHRRPANDYGLFVDSQEYVLLVAVPVVERFIEVGARVVLTPGNRCIGLYPNPDSFGAIYQPASVGLQSWGRADAQPILYYGKSPNGGQRLPSTKCSYLLTEAAERNGHPCPKPERMWTQLVESSTRQGEAILDPFMGSGTTGVACANLGREFIGIEIDPHYFDIACERIEAAQSQGRLFA